ncbi:hypothetical protein F5878DRAFT_655675 [Lentinula raphanica]|uniref:Uncharacterized protein n=1 Tax=Lentinula raphanica TaxID=153919 RepID=A0AA38PKK1_9AGAR|nr:hypothetical protein F5878DRAFT_655675 [Lentinula raphanica]
MTDFPNHFESPNTSITSSNQELHMSGMNEDFSVDVARDDQARTILSLDPSISNFEENHTPTGIADYYGRPLHPETPTPRSAHAWPFSSSTPMRASAPPVETSPLPREVEPLVPPIVIDNLAKDFQLTEEQRKILHTFVGFGSVGEGLTRPDMLTRMFMLAVTFNLENTRPKDDVTDMQTMRGMMKDLKIRLEQSFSLTATQTKNIRIIAQEKIYDPMRTHYLGINDDVFNHIRDHADEMHFANIFGCPAYEVILERAVKKVCSSVRNGFRQYLRDSVSQGTSAAKFTHEMNKIYRRAGGPQYNDRLILIRNRRFIYDNQNVLWLEEDGSDTITPDLEGQGSQTDPRGENSSEPPAKKRKTLKQTAGGRVPKGQDFWSLVDAWYQEKKSLGKKITDAGWKQLIEDYIRFDEAGFRNPASNVSGVRLPLGPMAVPPQNPQPLNQGSAMTATMGAGVGGLGSSALAYLNGGGS